MVSEVEHSLHISRETSRLSVFGRSNNAYECSMCLFQPTPSKLRNFLSELISELHDFLSWIEYYH